MDGKGSFCNASRREYIILIRARDVSVLLQAAHRQLTAHVGGRRPHVWVPLQGYVITNLHLIFLPSTPPASKSSTSRRKGSDWYEIRLRIL